MNLTSPAEVRRLLSDRGIRPSRALGQSFLIDRNILRILVETAGLSRGAEVLEIGPGLGVLTEALLAEAGRVVAVEKDHRLHAFLAERFANESRLRLVRADMLDLDADELLAGGTDTVVSNLPYSSGSRMLVNLTMARTPPARMVVTVQKEVAERLAAEPGSRVRGLISVWVQRVYDVRLVKSVSRTCFWPAPEVGSVIVKLVRGAGPRLSGKDEQAFYDLTRRAFMHRRKQMGAILLRIFSPLGQTEIERRLEAAGIDKTARPEDLTVEDWCALARVASGGATARADPAPHAGNLSDAAPTRPAARRETS